MTEQFDHIGEGDMPFTTGIPWLLVTLSALWVYYDATANRIGKVTEASGLFNMSAGAWGVVTLGLWIIGFPSYLIMRSTLIQRAKEQPIEPQARAAKLSAFGAISGLVAVSVGMSFLAGSLPACNSPEVQSVLTNVFTKAGVTGEAIEGASEESYDRASKTRTCKAVVTAGSDTQKIRFTVEWIDEGSGRFLVQIAQ